VDILSVARNQSETGFLIIIPCFSRIPNSRSCRNCTSDIHKPMSLFCRLRKIYSTSSTSQSSHTFFSSVSLTILFTIIFFNVCRMGTCCTEICTLALCNSCKTDRLAYQYNASIFLLKTLRTANVVEYIRNLDSEQFTIL